MDSLVDSLQSQMRAFSAERSKVLKHEFSLANLLIKP